MGNHAEMYRLRAIIRESCFFMQKLIAPHAPGGGRAAGYFKGGINMPEVPEATSCGIVGLHFWLTSFYC